MIPSMAYAPQPTNGQIDQPKAQIQLIVMMETARSKYKKTTIHHVMYTEKLINCHTESKRSSTESLYNDIISIVRDHCESEDLIVSETSTLVVVKNY